MCQSMVNIQSPTAEIRRGKKRRRKKKEERNRMKIYMVSLLHRATINKLCVVCQLQRKPLSDEAFCGVGVTLAATVDDRSKRMSVLTAPVGVVDVSASGCASTTKTTRWSRYKQVATQLYNVDRTETVILLTPDYHSSV